MTTRPTVSGDLLRFVLHYSAQVGVDPAAALAAQGIEPRRVGTTARIGALAFGRLLDALAEASGDPCFGLHLGAWSERFPASQLVIATVLNSRTVGDALERLLRFHAILSDAVAPAIARRADAVAVRLGAPFHGRFGRHETDAAVAMIATLLRRLSVAARPLEVRLRRVPDGLLPEYERVLGAPVRADAGEDAISLAPASLAAPVDLADRELLSVLERQAARRLRGVQDASWAGRARRAVEAALLEDCAAPALARLARGLGLSPRTLQGRLAAEGVTYRRVVDAARHALAEERLRDPSVTLSEVAFLLGFADQSAFTHAFRRWTGRTPRSFRRAPRERGASVRTAGSARAAGRGVRSRRARPPR